MIPDRSTEYRAICEKALDVKASTSAGRRMSRLSEF